MLLLPIQTATTSLSGDKYVTMSLVIPRVGRLLVDLEEQRRLIKDPYTKRFATSLSNDVRNRFSELCSRIDVVKATLLHPGLARRLVVGSYDRIVSDDIVQQAHHDLANELRSLAPPSTSSRSRTSMHGLEGLLGDE